MDSFADDFNANVEDYVEGLELYEEALEDVQAVNELAGQVVDLVRVCYCILFISDKSLPCSASDKHNNYYVFSLHAVILYRVIIIIYAVI